LRYDIILGPLQMTDVKHPAVVCERKIVAQLGSGTYANVYSVIEDKQEMALRVFKDVKRYNDYGITNLVELDITTRLRHPHLSVTRKMLSGCLTGLAMLSDRADTDLSKFVEDPTTLRLPTESYLDICHKIFSAILFLHRNGYLHLDLDPANILLKKVGDVYEPIVSDFDLSTRVDDTKTFTRLEGPIGSFVTSPVEIFKGTGMVSGASDVWSLGMIMVWVFGRQLIDKLELQNKPYQDNDEQFLNYIEKWFAAGGQIKHTLDTLLKIVPEVKTRDSIVDLITKMLNFDPKSRITLEQAIIHPVFGTRTYIDGKVDDVSKFTHTNCSGSIQRVFLNAWHIFHPILTYAPEKGCPTAALFLAVDLIYRSASLIKNQSGVNILAHNAACHYMGWKFYRQYMNAVPDANGFIKSDQVSMNVLCAMEILITLELKGRIYRPYIYDACTSDEQLISAMHYILPYSDVYLAFTPSMLCRAPSETPVIASPTRKGTSFLMNMLSSRVVTL
jgi:serine/threonine protein kinase